MKHHHLNDHSEESIKCDICEYTANSKYKVAVHRKRHFVKTTNCPECGKVGFIVGIFNQDFIFLKVIEFL